MHLTPETTTVVPQESRAFAVDYTGQLDALGLIWNSDDTRIARVAGVGPTSGEALGLTPGSAKISVSASSYSTASATLTVANTGPTIWSYSLLPYVVPYTKLWGFASTSVFAMSPVGPVLRYDGVRWIKGVSDIGGYAPRAIWGSGAGDIYVGGRNGALLHSTDGSGYDVVQGTGITKSIRGLWGSSAFDVYAVGDSGLVAHSDGTRWSEETAPTTDALNGIWGSSPSDVYAISERGGIYHRTAGAWLEVMAPVGDTLNAIWGSGATDVYAVGTHGSIYRYDGTSWKREDIGSDATLYSVWGPSAADVYVVGEGITLHKWSGRWRRLAFTTTMQAVWGRTPNDIHFVNVNGETLHGTR